MFRCIFVLFLCLATSASFAELIACPPVSKVTSITVQNYYYNDSKLYALFPDENVTIDNQEWTANLYTDVSMDMEHANKLIKKLNTRVFDYIGSNGCTYTYLTSEKNTPTPRIHLQIRLISNKE